MHSDNPIVCFCAKLAKTSSSVVADNVRTVLAYMNKGYEYTDLITSEKQWSGDILVIYCAKTYDVECYTMSQFIAELCMIRDQCLLSNLSYDETLYMLNHVCTT